MLFTSLVLKGFKRMALNNVETFIIKPCEPIQLILGTNGSGKSSLIGELTPLPPNPNDYAKDGSKTITISHRGHTYVLKSDFASSQKHSFKKDGEEKNDGGTITVQKELCWQEFGVTAEIHDLLTGLELFTNMSPSRRREWFTTLSDVRYDYALEVFGRLKERARDIKGALNMAKKRLVAESEKLISVDEEARLNKEVQGLLDELDLLNGNRAPVERPSADYEQDINAGLEELTQLTNRLFRIRFIAPYGTHPYRPMERDEWGELQPPTFTCLADIDNFISELKREIGIKEALINQALSEHEKIEKDVAVLIQTGEEGIKALVEKQNDLRARKKTILAKRKLSIEGCEPIQCLSALDAVAELLVAVFSVLPENEDRRYSQTRLQDLQGALLQSKDERVKKERQLTHLSSQKAHLDAHKASGETECPQCHHRWIMGYSDQQYSQVVRVIEETEAELKAMDQAAEKLQEDIAAIEEYGRQYRDYIRCTRNWPVLNPFWEYLLDQGLVAKAPRSVLATLDIFRYDLGLELEAKKLDDELAQLQQLIVSAEEVGDADLNKSKARLDETTLLIEGLTAELTKLQKRLGEYAHYRRQMAEGIELGEKIASLKQQLEQMNGERIEMVRREIVNHCIRQLNHSLALKTETLNAAKLQKGIIDNLEKQIEQLAVQEEAAKKLAKELSPTDGLIAEGLLGFIRTFTSQMNGIIKRIWAYPLYIKDCGVSGESGAELDYKFPLVVQSKSNEKPDVKQGSSGMQEIVNLAFKMVAMKYLGLAESPLYLDEFGKTFDEAHRAAATEVIKNLMLQQPFTQLYMVSHYESSYGAMTNAEICVICPNNITIPTHAKYNQHVVIE